MRLSVLVVCLLFGVVLGYSLLCIAAALKTLFLFCFFIGDIPGLHPLPPQPSPEHGHDFVHPELRLDGDL